MGAPYRAATKAVLITLAAGSLATPALAETSTINAADTAWMIVATALVLMMTAPGLAMFYSGLVRKKNVLGVIMQCIFLMGLMSVIWALYGYSLSFGGSEAWLGNSDYLFMKGVQAEWVDGKPLIPQHTAYSIPMLTHMLFQGMFFIITPALICGAFAERMKFSTMVVFMILWGTIVYCPLAHWVWGGGWLFDLGALDVDLEQMDVIDSGRSAIVVQRNGLDFDRVHGSSRLAGSERMRKHWRAD